MTACPEVTVVMAVRNGADELAGSIESILAQQEVQLELIVVDNGSTDGTADIIAASAARDPRVRMIRIGDDGLTAALIAGCAAARSPWIARADVGDRSKPWRLRRQIDALTADPSAVLASCGVRYIAPRGEHLFTSRVYDARGVRSSLLEDPPERVRNINHHGSALFSRAAYEAAGGYRPQFWFAQDLDLWIRLARLGEIVIYPEVQYVASITAQSVSSVYRKEQQALKQIAVSLRDAPAERHAGLLDEAARIRPVRRSPSRRELARGDYFIGRALQRRGQPRARHHLARAVRNDPFNVRNWAALLLTILPRRKRT